MVREAVASGVSAHLLLLQQACLSLQPLGSGLIQTQQPLDMFTTGKKAVTLGNNT